MRAFFMSSKIKLYFLGFLWSIISLTAYSSFQHPYDYPNNGFTETSIGHIQLGIENSSDLSLRPLAHFEEMIPFKSKNVSHEDIRDEFDFGPDLFSRQPSHNQVPDNYYSSDDDGLQISRLLFCDINFPDAEGSQDLQYSQYPSRRPSAHPFRQKSDLFIENPRSNEPKSNIPAVTYPACGLLDSVYVLIGRMAQKICEESFSNYSPDSIEDVRRARNLWLSFAAKYFKVDRKEWLRGVAEGLDGEGLELHHYDACVQYGLETIINNCMPGAIKEKLTKRFPTMFAHLDDVKYQFRSDFESEPTGVESFWLSSAVAEDDHLMPQWLNPLNEKGMVEFDSSFSGDEQ